MIPPEPSPSSQSQEQPSLLSVLKALPADCVRNNLVSAFGRLRDIDSSRSRPPIGAHQWLPGQWTPVLYGLSHGWRTYARCVLTRSLTVDLAIAVSLQRTQNPSESLEAFLSGFPSLQHLTVLAGNGGAPVDDSVRPPPTASGYGNGSSTLLAMAEAVNVALATQQLLHLSRSETTAANPDQGMARLTSLELRLHPAVWRALRGFDPDEFLARLVAAHPSLESLTVNVAAPPMPPPSLAVSPAPVEAEAGSMGHDAGPLAVVGVGALATLPGLTRLRFVGPIALEGLAALVHLQALSIEGVIPTAHDALPALTALTCLRLSDSHLRPLPSNPPQTARTPGPAAVVLSPYMNLSRMFRSLRALHLPQVAVGPSEWHLLAALCPTLCELELANLTPRIAGGGAAAAAAVAAVPRLTSAAAAAAAAAAGATPVPDWFLRATVGDEVAYSTGTGITTSVGSGSGGVTKWQRSGSSLPTAGSAPRPGLGGSSGEHGSRISPKGSGIGAASRCPFAALTVSGGSGGAANAAKRMEDCSNGSGCSSAPLIGVRQLTLWEYMAPLQLVDVLQLIPDLRELRGSLLLDDPPDVPAAGLRPAAVAALRPLAAALRTIHDVRLSVSCDPAAVTGQLAGLFLMESGLADVAGIQGLSLTVWVAAEKQLGSLAALLQLRSLELTLGKQEQESELSVLTRLERLSYLSLQIVPGIWNEIQGRTGRVTAGAALRLAMSFAAGQVLLLVADVHREICEDEAISLLKSVEMTTGQPGAAWAVSAWVEDTAECIMGLGPSAGASGTLGGGGGGAAGGGGGGGDGVGVLRVVWTPELVRRLLGVVAAVEGRGGPGGCGAATVNFMGSEEQRLGRVLGS
ncbi:hypothetical protein VOLCADRAFT_89946 [Volvox carteri f. nagariensis]|uniref:Uncharacterized protein n=1 Tax=Volvox carteri f. nagariensis TaxID=3068 RepID=D8TT30_VOLCA|nr:uncharacterized protein VOLCADRAFT_89946 [Volvox carteri f. nagariensis]EFJ49586.1 hypothetical protein VOLCADRAFT_89946 [Volvox carteri f. nagariensis]|eukprot:XP_002949567.1 hypothetical protein VOLCADRAFT_89946 [Volvox carteri f. nagariensis]